MNHLLLVEDDTSLGATLKERLEREKYQVSWCQTLLEAQKEIGSHPFDLVILDVGLPDGSGFDFAKTVRNRMAVPFIFVTAMATAPYRLKGFELGAEEYIPKPFHLKEMLLRVKHVLENHSVKRKIKCGDLIIDFGRMAIVDKMGAAESLPARDFQLLKLLITAAPRVVSRDEILNQVWGEEKSPTNRTVDNVIVRLRSLLKDDGNIIRSVRGIGYQWVLPVEVSRG